MKNKILFQGLIFFLYGFTATGQLPKLNSYPVASATIYLDFDGEEVNSPVWNNGNTINCAPPLLSNTQVTEIFNRVSEDYRPFNINITTDIDVFFAAPIDKRMRVIITPTSGWYVNAGGVGYLGSFRWGDETPCFVFSDRLGNNPKQVAECCSHESGHTLGLSHQSKYDNGCNLTATYNDGTGSGETGWAPIMGNSYGKNMSGWNNGPTPYGCSNNQDNLSILSTQNGFGYRADDYSDDINISPAVISALNSTVNGIISTTNDKDAFTFSLLHNTNFHLEAMPYSIGVNNSGANLDIKIGLYDAGKNLVRLYNPSETMGVVIDTILNAGTYYLLLDGSGNTNVSDYGSLGSYKITGLFGVLPVCNILLSGVVNKNMHQLNWNIDCSETITNIIIQSSTDGVHFSNVGAVLNQSTFSYVPTLQTALYYRLQVISSSGSVVNSSTLLLKKANNSLPFTVSAFAKNDITITASCRYEYILMNENGSLISKGAGNSGRSNINMTDKSAGMYILFLSGCGNQQTERVLKL